LTIHLA
jgi:hypothetical protein